MQAQNISPLQKRLFKGLEKVSVDFPLTPLNGKKALLGDECQKRRFTKEQMADAIHNGVILLANGKAINFHSQGFGLLTDTEILHSGERHYLMAVDMDGESAYPYMLEHLSNRQDLPRTVTFTFRRLGRSQHLFLVPEEYAKAIHTKRIKTSAQGGSKKEQVELRYANSQSCLPPSVHPTTGQPHWVAGCVVTKLSPDYAGER